MYDNLNDIARNVCRALRERKDVEDEITKLLCEILNNNSQVRDLIANIICKTLLKKFLFYSFMIIIGLGLAFLVVGRFIC